MDESNEIVKSSSEQSPNQRSIKLTTCNDISCSLPLSNDEEINSCSNEINAESSLSDGVDPDTIFCELNDEVEGSSESSSDEVLPLTNDNNTQGFATNSPSMERSTPDSLMTCSPRLCHSAGESSSVRLVGSGPKYKLVHEGDRQVCRLNHTRTVVSKIMNSKYLRRWESHHLMLGNSEIWSTTPNGFMENVIPYSSIQDINIISRWDAGHKFCIRITVGDGSVLLQANNSYLRDQWLHSIQWKRSMSKYDKLLRNTKRSDVLVKEIKNMIDLSVSMPIQDESVHQFPLDLVSLLLKENESLNHAGHEQIIVALAPLLEKNHPTQQMCDFFSKHCKYSPRSQIVLQLFTPVIHRILKHNMDFGRYPRMRAFIQEYIHALSSQNDGRRAVRSFVCSVHGPSSTCPHPRILPNLVAVILSIVNSYYEDKKMLTSVNMFTDNTQTSFDRDQRLVTYLNMLHDMSEFDDWRPLMGSLLQPIPFPDDALGHILFTSNMKPCLRNVADDTRCDVHLTVLGMREGKEGWFDLYCPGGIACDDEGQLYAVMLKRLISCCCRRKKFLQSTAKMISPWQLLALRENLAAMEALCAVLEFEVSDSADQKMQIITTLQSTSTGKKMYTDLYERQIVLRELQQKGGPRKLSLPSRSTDADVAKLLSSGSFGNLEVLSLAFTQVTSACAHDLIKLPSLRYLNLWSTQFGDSGLQLLSEHLHKLQVLNLCETPVTDKGLNCLPAMKNLRKLNLNSTHLSALAFEGLKDKLPSLQEFDIRYTDAW